MQRGVICLVTSGFSVPICHMDGGAIFVRSTHKLLEWFFLVLCCPVVVYIFVSLIGDHLRGTLVLNELFQQLSVVRERINGAK